MRAIKEVRKLILQEPDLPDCEILARLVLALENESNFPIADIYRLQLPLFDLALKLIDEWRLDRYYEGKARLFDVSYQVTRALRGV